MGMLGATCGRVESKLVSATMSTMGAIDSCGAGEAEADVRRLFRAEISLSSKGFGRVDGGSGDETGGSSCSAKKAVEAAAIVVVVGVEGCSIGPSIWQLGGILGTGCSRTSRLSESRLGRSCAERPCVVHAGKL